MFDCKCGAFLPGFAHRLKAVDSYAFGRAGLVDDSVKGNSVACSSSVTKSCILASRITQLRATS